MTRAARLAVAHSYARQAEISLEICASFGVSRFTSERAGQVRVIVRKRSRSEPFAWKCTRCNTTGTYTGPSPEIILAKFLARHDGETCP